MWYIDLYVSSESMEYIISIDRLLHIVSRARWTSNLGSVVSGCLSCATLYSFFFYFSSTHQKLVRLPFVALRSLRYVPIFMYLVATASRSLHVNEQHCSLDVHSSCKNWSNFYEVQVSLTVGFCRCSHFLHALTKWRICSLLLPS